MSLKKAFACLVLAIAATILGFLTNQLHLSAALIAGIILGVLIRYYLD